MKKTYIVNLVEVEKEITYLYSGDTVSKTDKQLVIIADTINDEGNILIFYLKGNCVGYFRKENVHSFYEYEEFQATGLDNLLDEFILSWRGIISLGANSIKTIYQKGLGEESKYILNCLLTDICEETKYQYDKHNSNLICSRCFKKYKAIDDYKENSLVYYGCPLCKQTNNYYSDIQKIICLLDNQSHLGHYVKNNDLYVNQLVVNQDFNFDSILILNASDFDIERFVVIMVENGIDTHKIELQIKGYVSDNSRKILEKYFLIDKKGE